MVSLTQKQFPPMSSDLVTQIEEQAKALNLSVEAYLLYLTQRQQPGVDAARLDRHVREVFGKQGDLMRRLAK